MTETSRLYLSYGVRYFDFTDSLLQADARGAHNVNIIVDATVEAPEVTLAGVIPWIYNLLRTGVKVKCPPPPPPPPNWAPPGPILPVRWGPGVPSYR